MKTKFGLICLLFMTVALMMPLTVLASDRIVQTDLESIQSSQFKSIIAQILDIKTNHPEYSEDVILEVMDRTHLQTERNVIDTWNALTDSEKRLCIRYPFDALKVNDAKNIAISQTEIKFGYNGLGDRSDAFRHGIWNAEMTVLIGKDKAELFATAHEDNDVTGNESDGYPKAAHREMDLHNNEVGRIIGNNNKEASEDQMADIIYEAVNATSSEFIWLHE